MTTSSWPKIRGPWEEQEARQFLTDAVIPLRIGVIIPSGDPLVMSLWFLLDGDEFLAATRPTSMLVRCLEASPSCGFEIAVDAPPYRGLRGQAAVEIDNDSGAATLDRLLLRYLGTLESPLALQLRARSSDETCLRIRPKSLTSWDFTRRMSTSLD